MQASFSWPVRVYYEDTDSGGVVYYANYLKFMERARTEWLRSLGFEQSEVRDEMGVLFVVRSATIEYRKPATFNDELNVVTTLEKVSRASIVFRHQIMCGDQLLVEGLVKVASVESDGFKPTAFPQVIKDKLVQI
jgi:acyl-CoA thioester hydrolase